jgi:hypothetical protein
MEPERAPPAAGSPSSPVLRLVNEVRELSVPEKFLFHAHGNCSAPTPLAPKPSMQASAGRASMGKPRDGLSRYQRVEVFASIEAADLEHRRNDHGTQTARFP